MLIFTVQKTIKATTGILSGNVYAEVDFLKHFTVRSSFGGIIDNNYGYGFNYVGYENAEGNTGLNSFSENASYNTQWTFTNTLTYGNTFGQHTVRALIGTEAVNYYGRNLGGTRSNYFSENPDYWTLNTGSPAGQSNTGRAYQSSLWSQFAKLEYNYAGKYLINGTITQRWFFLICSGSTLWLFPGCFSRLGNLPGKFMKAVSFYQQLKTAL